MKQCHFRCSRPPDVDVIKIFCIKMTRPLNIKIKKNNVLQPGHLYQKLSPEITMFCSEFMKTKTIKPTVSKPRCIDHQFDFISFSARPVLVLDHSYLTPGAFLIRFRFSFDPLSLESDSLMNCYSKSPF